MKVKYEHNNSSNKISVAHSSVPTHFGTLPILKRTFAFCNRTASVVVERLAARFARA